MSGWCHPGSVLERMATVVVPFRGTDPKQRLGRRRSGASRARRRDARGRARRRASRSATCSSSRRRRPALPPSATLVADPRRGQGAAVARRRSTRQSRPALPAPYLVVNADLPCATPRDLLALAGAVSGRRARARRRRRRHDERARLRRREPLRAGLRPRQRRAVRGARARRRVLDAPNLVDDVDTLDDLARLAAPARRAHPARARRPCDLRVGRVNVAVLSGGVGGARFLRGARRCRRSRQRFHRRQRRGRHRGARACGSRPIWTASSTRSRAAPTRSAAGAAPTRAGGRSRRSRELGGEAWFRLGDRDLGLHLVRTELLRERCVALARRRSGSRTRSASSRALLPATDDPVRTFLETPAGTFPFQTWFVARGHRDEVDAVHYAGAPEAARRARRARGAATAPT